MDETVEVVRPRKQKAREANLDNTKDPSIIWIDRDRVYALEKAIPFEPLLRAVNKYEIKDKEETENAGIEFNGCSYDNPHGPVMGGSFGHVLEHAICDSLDIVNNTAKDEVTSGSTIVAGINTDKPFDINVINHHYKVAIIPAPSIDVQSARDQVESIVEMLRNYDWTKEDASLEDAIGHNNAS